MKTTDLMIGDWIRLKEPEAYAGYIGMVTAINFKTGYLIVKVNTGDGIYLDCDVFIEDVEPIPLTHEILEKNGFSGDMYTVLDFNDERYLEYYFHESRLRYYYTGVDEWENHSEVKDVTFQCHCHYVHELQHALRLANIERSIEL